MHLSQDQPCWQGIGTATHHMCWQGTGIAPPPAEIYMGDRGALIQGSTVLARDRNRTLTIILGSGEGVHLSWDQPCWQGIGTTPLPEIYIYEGQGCTYPVINQCWQGIGIAPPPADMCGEGALILGSTGLARDRNSHSVGKGQELHQHQQRHIWGKGCTYPGINRVGKG